MCRYLHRFGGRRRRGQTHRFGASNNGPRIFLFDGCSPRMPRQWHCSSYILILEFKDVMSATVSGGALSLSLLKA